MAGMLTRLVAALTIVMGFGVLTAWAWDRSESSARTPGSMPASYTIQAESPAAADTTAQ